MDRVRSVCCRVDEYRRCDRFIGRFKTGSNNSLGCIKYLVLALLFDNCSDLFGCWNRGEFANQTRNAREIIYEATRTSRNTGRIAASVVDVSGGYSVQSHR